MAIMGILQFRKIEYVPGLQNLMSSQKVIRTLLVDFYPVYYFYDYIALVILYFFLNKSICLYQFLR